MTKILFTAIFLVFAIARAEQAHRLRLPLTLDCHSKATYGGLRHFQVEFKENKDPYITLDASFLEKALKDGVLTLKFSNECDSWFEFSLENEKLSKLSEDKINSMVAQMSYSHPDLDWDSDENIKQETTTVTCRKLPETVQTIGQRRENARALKRYMSLAGAKTIQCTSKDGNKLIIKDSNSADTWLEIAGDYQYGTNEITQISLGSTALIEFGEEGNYQLVFTLTDDPKQFGAVGSAYVVSEAEVMDVLTCEFN